MKAICKGTFCTLQFSQREDHGSVRALISKSKLRFWIYFSASFCRRGRFTGAKSLPAIPSREINSYVVIAIRPGTRILILGDKFSMSRGTLPSLQNLAQKLCRGSSKPDLKYKLLISYNRIQKNRSTFNYSQFLKTLFVQTIQN